LIELFKDEILPYINITGEKGGERTIKLYIAAFITPKGVIAEKVEIQTKNTGFPLYQARGRLNQASNDRVHETYVVAYKELQKT